MVLCWLCSGAQWFAQNVPSYLTGGGTGGIPDPAVSTSVPPKQVLSTWFSPEKPDPAGRTFQGELPGNSDVWSAVEQTGMEAVPVGGRFGDIRQEGRVSTGQPPGDVPHELWVLSRFLWGSPRSFSPSHSPKRCLWLCAPRRNCRCLCVEGTSPAPCACSRVSPAVTPLRPPCCSRDRCPPLVTRLVFGLSWGFIPSTVRGGWGEAAPSLGAGTKGRRGAEGFVPSINGSPARGTRE